MENINDEFISLFRDLEDTLNRLVGFIPTKKRPKMEFGELLEESIKKNPIISSFIKELKDYAQIRNIFVHERKGDKILVIKEEIDKFKSILEMIKNPPTVYDKFKREVFTCQTSESLLSILKIMKEKTYTHIPVYENNKFVGILSEVSVTNWLVEKKEVNLGSVTISDLKNYLNNQPNEFFEFVKMDENAFIVRDWFNNKVKEHKRLGAVFITKTGSKEEKLLGVITAWDLTELSLSKLKEGG